MNVIAWLLLGGVCSVVFAVLAGRVFRLMDEQEALLHALDIQRDRIRILEGEVARARDHCQMADELADELYMEYADERAVHAVIEYTLEEASKDRNKREGPYMPYWVVRLGNVVETIAFSKS